MAKVGNIIQKDEPIVSEAVRKSAKGQPCTIRLEGVCNHNPETTVLCHGRGAGWALKASDEISAYGCSDCHAVVDGIVKRPGHLSELDVEIAFWRGHARTLAALRRRRLITVLQ